MLTDSERDELSRISAAAQHCCEIIDHIRSIATDRYARIMWFVETEQRSPLERLKAIGEEVHNNLALAAGRGLKFRSDPGAANVYQFIAQCRLSAGCFQEFRLGEFVYTTAHEALVWQVNEIYAALHELEGYNFSVPGPNLKGEVERERLLIENALNTPTRISGPWPAAKIAEVYAVDRGKLEARLSRWRRKNTTDWIEAADRRPRAPRYLYEPQKIAHIIRGLGGSI